MIDSEYALFIKEHDVAGEKFFRFIIRDGNQNDTKAQHTAIESPRFSDPESRLNMFNVTFKVAAEAMSDRERGKL